MGLFSLWEQFRHGKPQINCARDFDQVLLFVLIYVFGIGMATIAGEQQVPVFRVHSCQR